MLDGQQRLTSIFRVIFRSRIRNKTTPDPDLLVALSPGDEWLENPFHLRSKTLQRRMKDGLLVPAEVLFEGVRGGNESLAVQRALGEWLTPKDELFFEALDRANAIRMSILQAEVIAYEIDADANDDNVIEIFARLNQQGVRLRPGDLAAARLTGQMTNFRTRSREVLVMKELRGFSAPEGVEEGSRSGAFVDTDLLIRAALFLGGGGVRYRDAEKRKLQAHYQSIEASWDAAVARLQERGGAVSQRRRAVGRLAAVSIPAVRAGDRGGARPRAGRSLGRLGDRGQPVAPLRRRGRHQAGEGRRAWPRRATSTA